jgi:hypothetical protein
MTSVERERTRDLLKRAGVSGDVIEMLRTGSELLGGLAVASDLLAEKAPDKDWHRDCYLLTGEHMVLTEEGWVPAEMNQGADAVDVLDEVNAPAKA